MYSLLAISGDITVMGAVKNNKDENVKLNITKTQ